MVCSPFEFDFEAIREEARRTGSRQLKREWIKKGYEHQMSLYGAVYNQEENKLSARRIEILSDNPWRRETLKAVADSFDERIPPFRYSVWAYSNRKLELKLLGGYD